MPLFTSVGLALGASAATAAATGAAAIGAGAAAIGTGVSAASAMQGQQAQQDAARQQKKAQTQATAAAASQQRQSEMAINAANRRSPDVSSIMAGASKAAGSGVSGTMLTGPAGVDPNSLALGRSSLLGG